MAQRDYVARGQKKRPVNKKNRKAVEPSSTPWFRILLALCLIGGFGYGLWVLSQKSDSLDDDTAVSQSNSTPTPVETTTPASENKAEPLPVLEEEEWEFIEALPNYSVEVDVEEQQVSDRRYLMQCGSFRTQEQAQVLKAQIAFQGLEAQVLKSNGGNGLWHRVVLGPFERKRQAERERHQLRQANINNCKIWFWD